MSFSKIQVPPDSTGKKIATKEFTVDGETVQVQSVFLSSGTDISHNLQIDDKGSLFSRFKNGNPELDAYSGMDVTEFSTIGSYEDSLGEQDGLFSITTNLGGEVISENYRTILRASTTSGSLAQKTTNRYHYYSYGSGFLILITAEFGDNGKSNNVRRFGYYDDYNGCYFELDGENLFLVNKYTIEGEPNMPFIHKRQKEQWSSSTDPDQDFSSYFTWDPKKEYTYFIQIRWPGYYVFGVYSGGERVIFHKCTSAFSDPKIMSLPLRFENVNTDIINSTSELFIYSSAVLSDRKINYVVWRYTDMYNPTSKIITQKTPILSLKSKTYVDGKINRTSVYPETLSIYSTKPVWICASWDGCLEGATWALNGEASIEGDYEATSISFNESCGNSSFFSYFCNAGVTNIDISKQFELNDEGICLLADASESYILTFSGTALTEEQTSVRATLTYRELR